jgi:hypothetical protein
MIPRKRSVSRIVCLSLAAYLISYLLLMTRNTPAYDAQERFAFRSSCRFTPHPHTMRLSPGGMTTVVGRVTFLNYLYYPLDVIFFF